MQKISLTGIKPTGTPHLGNYLGAIRPALELTKTYQTYYFIADYHAMTLPAMHQASTLRDSIYQVTATWLALGLNPEESFFYKQSDIPEIFELNWILSCFTPKGFMNRAHSYKDKTAKNLAEGLDCDEGINMGLYGYPCLMNADILLFGSSVVPVGRDQKQHVEFARDVAQRFNSQYQKDLFTLPEPLIREETDVIPGLDGRKMSKSYGNTIEIFLDAKELKKRVGKIVTNSLGVEEPKNPDTCNVFALYRLFATPSQSDALAIRYRTGGMGFGHAKVELLDVLEETFARAREKYLALLADLPALDRLLAYGALRARPQAKEMLSRVRSTIGIPG